VETVGDAGVTFSGEEGVPSLTAELERLLGDPDAVEGLRDRARERARRYSWEAVTDQYEELLRRAVAARGPGALPPELVEGPG
jgi:glycosyltransferase involved in cell wall biosynthesis